MRDELKKAITDHYSKRHSMFQEVPIEEFLPERKAKSMRFSTGFLIGSITTGAAFAALIATPYFNQSADIARSTANFAEDQVFEEPTLVSEISTSQITLSDPMLAEQVDLENYPNATAEQPISQAENSATKKSKFSNSKAEPEDNNALTLSQRVRNILEEVQFRQLDNQWDAALNEMNALYLEFERLNTFEQASLLNFYTNTLLKLEMWDEAITAFSLLTTIPDLRPDANARATLALGQLHQRVGDIESSIYYFETWLESIDGLQISEERIQGVKELITNSRQNLDN
jgi:tetratricopeptide (TPR) repeat protein